MTRIRVLVVEDSLTVRKHLCDVLRRDASFDVVGEAEDGGRAIELCGELRPDVVAMDMMLPLISGLAATEYIMAYFPTPILIVSSSTNRGELFKTYDALAAGAVDVLEKPGGRQDSAAWEREFLATLKLVARIRVITHPRARLGALGHVHALRKRVVRSERACGLVAIGASTGGPGAIVEVLRALPADFAPPILFVLHIGASFSSAFADWLDGQTPRRVRYARDGEELAQAGGRVLVAPPDRHLVLAGGRLRLSAEPERHSCRPSVDVLFESIARDAGPGSVACLLTGMGRDGAAGLLAVRKAGGVTVAQDEASCVVYGMPREAVALGAAERVLPLGEIGPFLSSFAVEREVRHP